MEKRKEEARRCKEKKEREVDISGRSEVEDWEIFYKRVEGIVKRRGIVEVEERKKGRLGCIKKMKSGGKS